MSNPKTIYLKDYTPPPFLVDQVDLRFDIHDSHTRVDSRMLVSRNAANPQSALRLCGIELELIEIALNGHPLSPERYACDKEGLTIHDVPDEFTVEITTRIHPESNTSLMGLYRSNHNFYTQCEAEGFRKITYFPDRPDVMSRYSTTIIASRSQCPVLLSNGNLVGEGIYDKHRHWAKWVDPYRKPSYFSPWSQEISKSSRTNISPCKSAASCCRFSPNPATCTNAIMPWLPSSMRWNGTRSTSVFPTIWTGT